MFQTIFNEHNLEDCGLFIDKELYFICTSPLKLYGNDSVVNIKCPLKEYNKNFDQVIHKIPLFKNENGHMNLNKKSDWYIEVQSELRITGRKHGFIMVWLGESHGEPQYRIIEVTRNDSFFDKEIKPKLIYFYNEVMVKELVDSRRGRFMELRQYSEENQSFI